MKQEDDTTMSPREVRARIRDGRITGQTSGMCAGYAQANLVVLPAAYAYDFLLFSQRNPRACPLLEVSDTGSRFLKEIAKGADIAREIPRYRIFRNGILAGEYTDVSDFWQEDFVSFLIGCSFSFEAELLDARVPVRHIEEGRNVPMYRTSISCAPAGIFHGNMVVSMRPIPFELVPRAVQVTGAMPRVHGAPIHIGCPEAIGITDLHHPDFGDMVTIREGEVPVFWPCGVTPQNVVMESKPTLAITHAPGHMLITDIRNTELKF
ncbi:MAG: putative hydro-lyase [Lachnospiraceae bacterium]|nr:putative hydro-lyase [Lachnospiraceae bacterium]